MRSYAGVVGPVSGRVSAGVPWECGCRVCCGVGFVAGCFSGDGFLAGQRVLVVAPHADDETYGCAGTIARVKSLGGEVFVLVGSVAALEHYGSTVAGQVMHHVSAG